MNILNPLNSWAADQLPDGISLHHGILSGTPTAKGNFSVPVTVSNSLGSDTKNISIITKYRPGVEKFSILQDGVEVAKLSIPELQAMVQDGSAQQRFNCQNTQIVIPVVRPQIKYSYNADKYNPILPDNNKHLLPSVIQYVPVNFCSFRNVTLQDGSTRLGLILQFDQSLWAGYAPFDTGDSVSCQITGNNDVLPKNNIFNRWRYSNLRQWLNSEGKNWFVPAYNGDTLVTFQDYADAYMNFEYPNGISRLQDKPVSEEILAMQKHRRLWLSNYTDDEACGFLDLLPDDIHSILQPVKIVTQAFFDAQNDNLSIEDPDDIDGVDADITYDKVFLPSIDEMYLAHVFSYAYFDGEKLFPESEAFLEGAPWEYYVYKFGSANPFTPDQERRNSYDEYVSDPSDWGKAGEYSKFATWAKNLLDGYTDDMSSHYSASYINYHPTLGYLSRSAELSGNNLVWYVANAGYSEYATNGESKGYEDIVLSCRFDAGTCFTNMKANPAPAFVIC